MPTHGQSAELQRREKVLTLKIGVVGEHVTIPTHRSDSGPANNSTTPTPKAACSSDRNFLGRKPRALARGLAHPVRRRA